jgi:hypothetical protein
VELACTRCSHFISVQPGLRIPPWCPKCGADLKDCLVAEPKSEASTASDVEPQAKLAENLRERFTRHNFAVGVLLAGWGLLIGVNGQPTDLEKLLHGHPILAIIVAAIQWLTLATGGLLWYSGHGVRARQAWGESLAKVSAIGSILIGIVFLGVFWYMGRFEGLENSAARVNYTTSNLNLLVGLVDGVGLLVFLHRYRTPAAQPDNPSPGTR